MLNTVGGTLEGCDCACDCTYLRTAGPYTQPPSPTPFVKRSPTEGETISPTTRRWILPLPPSTVTHRPIRLWSWCIVSEARTIWSSARGACPAMRGGCTYPFKGSKARRRLTRCPSIAAVPDWRRRGWRWRSRTPRGILGEERAILCLLVVQVVGIAHEHVPVPTLLTRAGNEIMETRADRERGCERGDAEHRGDERTHERHRTAAASGLEPVSDPNGRGRRDCRPSKSTRQPGATHPEAPGVR